MKIIDLNRAGGIAANSLYLEIGPFSLVVDAGINPKVVGTDTMPEFDKIPARHLDAILLTHCHLDHLGSMPVLSRLFPASPVITSEASAILAPRMLQNSLNVMRMQREDFGVREYPLYSRSDITNFERNLIALPFKKTRRLTRGEEFLEITLYCAGHVAGAASILLTYKHRRILITGDLLFCEQWTIPGADIPRDRVDTLITETTKAATTRNGTRLAEAHRLLSSINATLEAGGPVLIPVFALGRMQEMLSLLWEAKRDRALLPCPIYCSGLGVDLVDYYDQISRKNKQVRFSHKILRELKVQSLPNFDPRIGLKESAIYLVSSGMMTEKTPSYSLAATMIGIPHASVLFVGYCDGETPGGQIQRLRHGQHYLFSALDIETELRANIESFDLSGHADKDELLDFAASLQPRAVVLTHGDPLAREVFRNELEGIPRTILDPVPLKEYTV